MGEIGELNNDKNAVILFDGVCNLCQGSVQFIIKRDKEKKFRFASLQSDFAKEILAKFEIDASQIDSVILIYKGSIFSESSAALEIAKRLTGFWPLLYVFRFVPKRLRDAIYKIIAQNRYKWFGKKDECMLPSPENRQLFLDT